MQTGWKSEQNAWQVLDMDEFQSGCLLETGKILEKIAGKILRTSDACIFIRRVAKRRLYNINQM